MTKSARRAGGASRWVLAGLAAVVAVPAVVWLSRARAHLRDVRPVVAWAERCPPGQPGEGSHPAWLPRCLLKPAAWWEGREAGEERERDAGEELEVVERLRRLKARLQDVQARLVEAEVATSWQHIPWSSESASNADEFLRGARSENVYDQTAHDLATLAQEATALENLLRSRHLTFTPAGPAPEAEGPRLTPAGYFLSLVDNPYDEPGN